MDINIFYTSDPDLWILYADWLRFVYNLWMSFIYVEPMSEKRNFLVEHEGNDPSHLACKAKARPIRVPHNILKCEIYTIDFGDQTSPIIY